jgi:hypothetical protein
MSIAMSALLLDTHTHCICIDMSDRVLFSLLQTPTLHKYKGKETVLQVGAAVALSAQQ